MKVSVITPTVRKDGLELVKNSLNGQLYSDFEWLVGSSFDPELEEATWIRDDFIGGFWTLNRIYNKLFAHATGDIIVSWQDWIWAAPDALKKFVEDVEETNGGIISGVGDQYERLNKWGRPEVKIWSDPRKNGNGNLYECYPNDVEWNFAAFPRKAILEVGGMDEQLDFLGFGGDQLQVGERFDALHYKSYLDQSLESFTIRHDRSKHGGQTNWDDKHVLFNGQYDKRKAELISEGKWPVLNYL